jgi:hypothetical protein
MTEFLKNNLNLKDVMWVLMVIIPGIFVVANVQSEQQQQKMQIEDIKLEMRVYQGDAKSDRKELITKVDKLIEEVASLKATQENKDKK